MWNECMIEGFVSIFTMISNKSEANACIDDHILHIISSSRFLQRLYVLYVIMHVVVLFQCPGRTLVQDANITSGPPSLTHIISAFLPFSFIGPFMRWAFTAHLTKMSITQSHQLNIRASQGSVEECSNIEGVWQKADRGW